MKAEDRITKAHIALMKDPRTLAYSGILMVGKAEVLDDALTARTNGRDVQYGRAFVDKLTDPELKGLILHEAKHKMYMHLIVWRKLMEEDMDRANRACDYVINLEIHDLNPKGDFIKLPEGGLVDEQYRGLDSGQVFKLLEDDGGDGKGLDEHDWEDAQALDGDALAKEIDGAIRTGALLAGKQGGDMDRSFDTLMAARVDWAEQLREFVNNTCAGKGDSTWAKPNRRWLSQGIYMPSQISETIGSICVAIDTSGSIGGEDIAKALAEVVSICDNTTPEKVDLLYWDTSVASHEQYREDNYAGLLTSTKPAGGGGTSVGCVMDYIKDNQLKPECTIIITDGYTDFPSVAPPYPVIWVMVGSGSVVPPFGVTIRIG
jgi:predicted metal-dependent peptidase